MGSGDRLQSILSPEEEEIRLKLGQVVFHEFQLDHVMVSGDAGDGVGTSQ